MAQEPKAGTPEVIDPVTGEPLRASRLNSLVVGEEELPVAMEDDDDPDAAVDTDPVSVVARNSGTQHIAHIGNPNSKRERQRVIDQLRAQWRQDRKARGLD